MVQHFPKTVKVGAQQGQKQQDKGNQTDEKVEGNSRGEKKTMVIVELC
jgi:hypothetical protein